MIRSVVICIVITVSLPAVCFGQAQQAGTPARVGYLGTASYPGAVGC